MYVFLYFSRLIHLFVILFMSHPKSAINEGMGASSMGWCQNILPSPWGRGLYFLTPGGSTLIRCLTELLADRPPPPTPFLMNSPQHITLYFNLSQAKQFWIPLGSGGQNIVDPSEGVIFFVAHWDILPHPTITEHPLISFCGRKCRLNNCM